MRWLKIEAPAEEEAPKRTYRIAPCPTIGAYLFYPFRLQEAGMRRTRDVAVREPPRQTLFRSFVHEDRVPAFRLCSAFRHARPPAMFYPARPSFCSENVTTPMTSAATERRHEGDGVKVLRGVAEECRCCYSDTCCHVSSLAFHSRPIPVLPPPTAHTTIRGQHII